MTLRLYKNNAIQKYPKRVRSEEFALEQKVRERLGSRMFVPRRQLPTIQREEVL